MNPLDFKSATDKILEELARNRAVERLRARDVSLWQEDPDQKGEEDSFGWLEMPEWMEGKTGELDAFAREIRGEGFFRVLLLGMGGSSLAPDVFGRTFGAKPGYPSLLVLDSTDPEAILDMDRQAPPEKTLYIVSSKSGTTTEPLRLLDYFFARASSSLGSRAGGHFAAITDPGSPLEKLAGEKNFRRVFLNPPDIGGRYSALSYFGLAPAALIGADVADLLDRARRMARSCSTADAASNPGLRLAAELGAMSEMNRDKVTFFISPELPGLGLWIEQLLAESTGKQGKGLVPITGEPLLEPKEYGNDRAFVCIRTEKKKDPRAEALAQALERAGHPVVRIEAQDRRSLGAEFYRWEVATTLIGHILRINPFDQPDVQESKNRTNALLSLLKNQKELPEPETTASDARMSLAFSKRSRELLRTQAHPTTEQCFGKLLSQIAPGDYAGVLAYAAPDRKYEEPLRALQGNLARAAGVAVQLGYGPRYLHSTGQLHKGGPASGVFLMLVREDAPDLPIPGSAFGFSRLIFSQALGDFQALDKAGRRAVLVRVRGPLENAVKTLSGWISSGRPSTSATSAG